jgi:hypothetical protein
VLISQTGSAGAMAGVNKATLRMQAAASSGPVNMSNPGAAEEMMKQREGSVTSSNSGGKRSSPKPAAESSSEIPTEYSDPSKTPLSYEVKLGSNSFDIAIP